MSDLSVTALSVHLGGTPILCEVNIAVAHNTLAAVVGPSGSGKSTLLRAIAGLTPISAGEISLGSRVLGSRVPGSLSQGSATKAVPAQKRDIGWVPQSASLFPHLTVMENVSFGAGGKGSAYRKAARDRCRDLVELVGLGALSERYPEALSGGQAQRVALARALAAQPQLLLLDEPFSALDPGLRSELREELREMLRRLEVTAIMVTHDQAEALVISDSVMVLREGQVAQQGSPRQVYRRPVSPWVANFLGEANMLPGEHLGTSVRTELGVVALPLGDQEGAGGVQVMLRPEQLRLGNGGITARVTRVNFGGHDAMVELLTESGRQVRVRMPAEHLPEPGSEVSLAVSGYGVAYPV